jgi:hypothetical protein
MAPVTDMRLGLLLLAALFALGAFFFFRGREISEHTPHFHHREASAVVEPAPLCPWRDPQGDLLALFPGATNFVVDSRIVTGRLGPIQKLLGRPLNPDENPLRIYRVLREGRPVGAVLVTRVKAEHGGIELVTGVDTNSSLRGVRIQSQREPEIVAQSITSSKFLAAFTGRKGSSPLRVGEDLPIPPEPARLSAEAIADGVRNQLIILSFAELPREARELGIYDR